MKQLRGQQRIHKLQKKAQEIESKMKKEIKEIK